MILKRKIPQRSCFRQWNFKILVCGEVMDYYIEADT